MRSLARLDIIAIRAEACRFALIAAGECASKGDMLEWIALFERVQIEGARALEGIYVAPPIPFRALGLVQ